MGKSERIDVRMLKIKVIKVNLIQNFLLLNVVKIVQHGLILDKISLFMSGIRQNKRK